MTPYVFVGLYSRDRATYCLNRDEREVKLICSVVSIHFNISVEMLLGNIRTRDVSLARCIAIYMMRELLLFKHTKIGRIFNKNHSTIIYSIDTLKDLMFTDKNIKRTVNQIIFIYEQKSKTHGL